MERIITLVLFFSIVGTVVGQGESRGLTGPRDPSSYPDPVTSPYRLPWRIGEAHLCVQGNRGIVSHRGTGEYSYDFSMPVGTEVWASRGGRVIEVVVSHRRRGPDAPNNRIGIDHGDGTIGWYLHLQQGGALVERGDVVLRGQAIGKSGNVGRSLVPHLHFHVTREEGGTIPVTFSDSSVRGDRGIPRIFRVYRSERE